MTVRELIALLSNTNGNAEVFITSKSEADGIDISCGDQIEDVVFQMVDNQVSLLFAVTD